MTVRRALILLPFLSVLLLAAPAASAEASTFADTAGTAHEDAVSALVQEGIVNGCDADTFCARDVLTRGQVATMLVGALDLPVVLAGQESSRFHDATDSVHATSIETLATAGFISGCGNDRFCPHAAITRGQLATMLTRAFDVPAASSTGNYFDDVTGVHGPAVEALAEAGIASGCTHSLTKFCVGEEVERAHAAMFLARTMGLVDPVELAPYEQRRAEQDEIDEAERKAAEEAAAKAAAEKAAAAAVPGRKAVDIAKAQLGKPYRWGGSGPGSFDCSGLTSFSWARAGVDLPRTSRAQYSATARISRSELRPGDLVFYHSPISHVAMYIGDGKVVEAPNSGNRVRVRNDGLTRKGVVGFGRP